MPAIVLVHEKHGLDNVHSHYLSIMWATGLADYSVLKIADVKCARFVGVVVFLYLPVLMARDLGSNNTMQQSSTFPIFCRYGLLRHIYLHLPCGGAETRLSFAKAFGVRNIAVFTTPTGNS